MQKRIRAKFIRFINSIYYRIKAWSNFSHISFSASLYISEGATFIIGRNVRIRPGCIVSIHDQGSLELKDSCWIGPGVVIYSSKSVIIGEMSRIAHYSSIIDHDYEINEKINFANRREAAIEIGSNTWLGCNVIVLKGVKIGNSVVIAAGTLVNKSIQDNRTAYSARNIVVKER